MIDTSPVAGRDVRVRFCPSPTGNPHVGLIRTCLFNWAYARHVGGTFVFRIEDTDAARDSQESYQQLVDSLRWLGLDWDEGPEVGGPYAPYRQSERGDLYRDVIQQLKAAGYVYEAFSTTEEVEARHRAAGRDVKLGYDNFDRELTDDARNDFRDQGRSPVLRFRMPAEEQGWTDLVRGQITFGAGSIPDFAVARANGDPLYTLVNPVDDAIMKITHVLRGEDLLPSTPRQIALYGALIDIGVADRVPRFAHLPYVMGEGNRKLSKRDPKASLNTYRDEGYVPEGLLNYLALLGWSIAADHDIFTLVEMVDAFDVADVNANPARFDPKKCEVINATHIRRLGAEDFARRLLIQVDAERVRSGLEALKPGQSALITSGAPLIQERIQTLAEGSAMLQFLIQDQTNFVVDERAAAKNLVGPGQVILATAVHALKSAPEWSTASIERNLRSALVDDLGLKPKVAFAPLRVAATGSMVAPPLFESLELLGRDRTLERLAAALTP